MAPRSAATRRGWTRRCSLAALRLVVCAVLVAPLAEARHEYLTREQALATVFAAGLEVELLEIRLSPDDRASLQGELRGKPPQARFEFYAARDSRGTRKGWAVVRDVLGKSEPITYMVAFDAERRVSRIEILAYRESHGGEIRRDAFRKQFVGKGRSAELALGRDIRNISGATISCRAITDGVHDDLRLLEFALSGRALSAAALQLSSNAEPIPRTSTRAQVCMGTRLEITLADVEPQVAHAAFEAAFAEAARIDALLSHFKDSSEISRIGSAAGHAAVPISPETLEVLRASLRLSTSTNGAFDPCLGTLTGLWQSARQAQEWPTENELHAARERSGGVHLQLSEKESTAYLDRAGVRIDLGGIGKGYALDRIESVLRERGVNAALLNFGGQILALDPPKGARGWPVEIAWPSGEDLPLAAICVARMSVATSSDAEQGGVVGNRRVSHIIDPSTGLPSERTRSTTACARRAIDADSWSTAGFVLGSTAGDLADRNGIACLWLDLEGRTVWNRKFDELLSPVTVPDAPER